jgi:hypothetical protein
MTSKSKMAKSLQVVFGQPSWRLASTEVEAFVTERGGHLGPVTFERQARKIQPYSVAPWARAGEEFDPPLPPMLQVLRGDFFCLPFGGNAKPFRGERHPAHGETANARWHLESLENRRERSCLHLSLQTKIRPGRVDKKIYLVEGQNILYCRDVVSGMRGPMNLGHHAMLQFPDEPGGGLISTSGFVFGQVCPRPLESAEQGGYSCLKEGAEFTSLEAVPMANGGTADLSRYPARGGYEDLVMLVNEDKAPFAWTAVAFPKERFVWFALKDPRVLRGTIFWISNRGRHYPPWNGRHVRVMGLEEVTSFFHFGLAESAARNAMSEQGFATCLRLEARKPLAVNYIMGLAGIPAGFDRVVSVEAQPGRQSIVLRSAGGRRIEARVDLDFLAGAENWKDTL